MKFSTRTTYGLRAMIFLARNRESGSVSLPSIARLEGISLSYLERLFAKLKKADLIKSVKGSAGGYRLARAAGKIAVFDIIKSLEGKLTPFYCLKENGKIYCDRGCECKVTLVLIKVQTAIDKALKSVKLSDLR